MSAHASQAFSIVHCTDSEDLPLFFKVFKSFFHSVVQIKVRVSFWVTIRFMVRVRVRVKFSVRLTSTLRENFHITSHHIEETEAGLKGLYIREITTVIDLLIRYY